MKFREDPNEELGADDLYWYERVNKIWTEKGIVAFVIMIILGLILIYEGITGVSPI